MARSVTCGQVRNSLMSMDDQARNSGDAVVICGCGVDDRFGVGVRFFSF